MDAFISGTRVRLNDSDLLGEGGEARVFRWRSYAVKIFHPPTSSLAQTVLQQKLLKVARFPVLPNNVVSPRELARDSAGRVIGYVMNAIDGAEDFARLSQRKWREAVVPNASVTALFSALRDVVLAVHSAGVIIGDFNDGNVLFAKDVPYLIDADSMQFDGLPCAVGHERFLDPRLYGVDLTSSPRFDAGTDWYAFAVMLFQSLLYVHPFGGTHAKLGTLLRRAEARHSVFQSDVTLPRLAVPPKVLPDDALQWFSNVFERDERTEPPPAVSSLRWSKCTCGLEHARSVCPECKALGPVVTRQVLRANGRCTARVAFHTTGRVLAAAMQGGLRYVWEEGGVVRREDGAIVRTSSLTPSTRFAIAGAATWVGDERGQLERLEGGRVTERASTMVRGTTPVLAASTSVAYRQEHEWLIDMNSGSRIGQVLEGQTWVWAGERLSLGFYRAGGFVNAFLLRAGKAGLLQLPNVTWRGRIVDAEAVFDAGHALLSVTTQLDGREAVLRWLFNEKGVLLGATTQGTRGHAALLGGRVVIATDAGLVAAKVDSGVLVETVCFSDSQPFVSAGDELLPQPDGSLYVVGSRDITLLTLT